MQAQTLSNLRGEIEFRRKLAEQHVTGRTLLPDYYGKEAHDAILRERMATTARELGALQARGIRLGPFLELGAERGQRALVLVNDLGCDGIAADISFDQLKTAEHFAQLFGKPKLPLRVCCDANRLPLRSGSLPFVFCYEFLHHFPELTPVVREIHRVLDGGIFFFDEEPYHRPRLPLFRQRQKVYAAGSLQRGKVLRYLAKFFTEEWCDEREHGIVENHDIPLCDWIAACRIFDEYDLTAASLEGRIRSRLGDRVSPRNLLNLLLGGGVTGLCAKRISVQPPVSTNPLDALICPDCLLKTQAEYSVQPFADGLSCAACDARFPQVDGVYFLLPTELFRALYPEIAARH
jgi:SAM-dependent methyltransferase